MKPATTFAISALVALAAAIPFQKRDEYTTTVVDEVTETVKAVTTVWVQPGDPRLLQQESAKGQKKEQAPAPAPAPVQSTTAVPVYSPPQTTSSPAPAPVQPVPQQKEVVQAPPTSTPAPAPAYTPPPAPAPVIAAPVAPASSPASSPSSSGPTGGSGSTGGSCGTVGGTCSGDATTFAGALGSCGYDDASGPLGDNYFALAWEMMGPLSNAGPGLPTNPYCNRTAVIKYNGKEFPTVLTDKCGGCQGQSIDLSPSLFAQVFDGATTGRYHDIEWSFTGPVVVSSSG